MRGFERYFEMLPRSTTSLEAVRVFLNYWIDRRPRERQGSPLHQQDFMDDMERHIDEPFFAFINYNEPHARYAPPSPFRERFLRNESDTPWGATKRWTQRLPYGRATLQPPGIKVFNDLYDGAVAYQDHRMGEFFEYLRIGRCWTRHSSLSPRTTERTLETISSWGMSSPCTTLCFTYP